MLLNKTLESPLDCKEIQPVHPKGNQSWIFIGRTDAEAETNNLATWCEKLTHLKRPWCCERLKAGGEGNNRGRGCSMASALLTQWTWIWASSRSWWWTGKPGVLQSMGVTKSQTRLSDWTTTTSTMLCKHSDKQYTPWTTYNQLPESYHWGRQRRKKEKLLLKAVNVYFSALFLVVKLIFGLRDNLFALNSLEHHFLKFIMQDGDWYN